MTDSPRPTVAIVVPVFNEEPVLPELFARLEALFAAPAECAWRAVFVDDGVGPGDLRGAAPGQEPPVEREVLDRELEGDPEAEVHRPSRDERQLPRAAEPAPPRGEERQGEQDDRLEADVDDPVVLAVPVHGDAQEDEAREDERPE